MKAILLLGLLTTALLFPAAGAVPGAEELLAQVANRHVEASYDATLTVGNASTTHQGQVGASAAGGLDCGGGSRFNDRYAYYYICR